MVEASYNNTSRVTYYCKSVKRKMVISFSFPQVYLFVFVLILNAVSFFSPLRLSTSSIYFFVRFLVSISATWRASTLTPYLPRMFLLLITPPASSVSWRVRMVQLLKSNSLRVSPSSIICDSINNVAVCAAKDECAAKDIVTPFQLLGCANLPPLPLL